MESIEKEINSLSYSLERSDKLSKVYSNLECGAKGLPLPYPELTDECIKHVAGMAHYYREDALKEGERLQMIRALKELKAARESHAA